MAAFVPTIGVVGLYRLLQPYTSALMAGVAYRCTALQTIQEVTKTGVDVFADYYEPYALTQADFDKDLADGVILVSLQPDNGKAVVVPNSYIAGMPDINGVPYVGTMLALDLAILPVSLDLAYLKQRLADVVLETVGVTTTARVVNTTDPMLITQEQHTVVEATRTLAVTEVKTDYAKYLEQKKLAESLQTRNNLLEQYIVDQRSQSTP